MYFLFTKVNAFACLTVRWAQFSFEQKLGPVSIGSVVEVSFRISTGRSNWTVLLLKMDESMNEWRGNALV